MQVYDRYYRAMFNTALRIVKHSAEAEDIMQDSFLSAFSRIDTYRGEVSFGAWLKRIVINNSIQRYKKLRRMEMLPLDEVLYKVEDAEVHAAERESQTETKAQNVLGAMKLLKDNYRIALTLHLIEGYDYEEICSIMDISYANCRTTISRAKEKLRKTLRELEL